MVAGHEQTVIKSMAGNMPRSERLTAASCSPLPTLPLPPLLLLLPLLLAAQPRLQPSVCSHKCFNELKLVCLQACTM